MIKPTYLNFEPRLPPRFLLNTGGGRFEDSTSEIIDGAMPTVSVATSTFIADFNGDGRADVFFVDQGLEDKLANDPGFDGSRNTVLLSQPDGRLKDTTSSSLRINETAFNHVSKQR